MFPKSQTCNQKPENQLTQQTKDLIKMNTISNIESAMRKLIPKLSTSAKAPLGSLMAFIKRAQSSWKVAIGMRERAQSSWKFANAMSTRAQSSWKFAIAMSARAQSSWKVANAISARAQSSWKFASPYFTFFQATKCSSSTYNNVTIS